MASSDTLDDDDVYWVLARRLCDSHWVKLKSNGLYVTTFDKMYWPFAPENPEDFDITTEYGVITKDSMFLHYILLMSALESEIDEALESGKDAFGKRILNPKRLRNRRSEPSVVPLVQFTRSSEIEGAKATMKSTEASKLAAEDAHNNVILQESLKKKKTAGNSNDKKHQNNSKPSSKPEGSKDGKSANKSQSNGKGNASKESTQNRPKSIEKNGDAKQTVGKASNSKKGVNGNDGSSATETTEVQRLKELVEKMRKEKEEAELKLQQTIESQASQKSVTKEDLKTLASQLSKQIMSKVQSLAIPSAAGNSGGVELNLLKNAVNPDESAPDDVGSDEVGVVNSQLLNETVNAQIFMGSERPLKRCDVVSVQRNFFKFPSRVKQLVNLLWGQDNVHKYYSTSDDNDNKLVISKDAVTCITNILLIMKWTSTDKPARGISEKTVKREIGKYTSEQRTMLKNKAKSAEEREARKKRIIENKRKRKGKKKMYRILNGRRVKLDTEDSELNNNSDDNSSVEEDKGSDEESNDEAGNISVEINSQESENEENRSEDEIVCRAEESFEANFEKESDDEIEVESRGQIPEFDDKFVTKSRSRRRPPGFTEDIMWSAEMELLEHQQVQPPLKKKKFQGRNMLDDSDDEDSGPGPENDHSDGSNTE
ncbi:hypothetical protein KUF71_012310 [Frankliniella fusca]|uniref:Uncharacterized protein n=1 Tax=Frankliniella fusca TaxID=407009 RepID=A0AAE1HNA0_9NEOP|nr:hypothetical protein KUF71_012310 [Frankliniella fusca]